MGMLVAERRFALPPIEALERAVCCFSRHMRLSTRPLNEIIAQSISVSGERGSCPPRMPRALCFVSNSRADEDKGRAPTSTRLPGRECDPTRESARAVSLSAASKFETRGNYQYLRQRFGYRRIRSQADPSCGAMRIYVFRSGPSPAIPGELNCRQRSGHGSALV
jgi:hypothetical protein